MQQQPKLTRAEVETIGQWGTGRKSRAVAALGPLDIQRLAQDCLAYMDALEQILQHIELDCLDCRCPIPASIARAVLPASEVAADAR